MARGVNKVILVGHLGADPQQRAMPNGNAVVNFNLATSEKWKDRQTGVDKEITEWNRCVAFGKLAEIIGQYARKGSQAFIAGKLRTRKWTDKDKIDRWTTEIVCDEFLLVGGKPQQGQQGQQRAADPRDPGGAQAVGQDSGSSSSSPQDSFDDDIPF